MNSGNLELIKGLTVLLEAMLSTMIIQTVKLNPIQFLETILTSIPYQDKVLHLPQSKRISSDKIRALLMWFFI